MSNASSGKYVAYPKYKKSEIQWAHQLPIHWGRVSLRWISKMYAGGTPSKMVLEYWIDGTVPWLNSGAVNQGLVTKPSTYITEDAYNNSSAKWIPKNALVMALAGQGKTKGMVAQLRIETTCNQSMGAIVPHKLSDSRYLFWWLTFNYQNIRNMSGGDHRDGLNLELLGSIECPIPTAEEKNLIANFLDHETAKIDTLIDKQQQLIKLLKEKRQAVISHAVTKGLNPQAPMKDSGVEWLGEVPEHWEVVQAKYIADITRGAILRPVDAPEYFDENGEWAYLNISDATKCDKYLYESKLRLSELGSTKSARVYPNNVIITASATIGKAFINKIKVCIHDGFIPFCNIKLDNNYLYHYLSNPYLYAAMGKSNTQKNIYLDEVKNMMVTVPPREEQIQIIEFLESNASKFNNLIKQAQIANKLMQERRVALISATVTGRIDVRNWQPCHGQEVDSEI